MERTEAGDILDNGPAPTPRSRATGIVVSGVLAAAIVIAALAAGLAWWNARPSTSQSLAVVDATAIGTQPVRVVAAPPVGALSSPAGTALPGETLRLIVGGDPGAAVEVVPAPADALMYVEQREPVTIPPGSFTEVNITVTPVDCSLAQSGLDIAAVISEWGPSGSGHVLLTTDGTPVPQSKAAGDVIGDALVRACSGAGEPPRVTVGAARRSGAEPLETIGLLVDIDVDADRMVATPLDGPGLRGLGSADRRSGQRIPLLWLVAPRASQVELTAFTQIYTVRGGTAYPWVVGVPVTQDLPAMTPLTNSLR
jgi:hypothetical protein